MRLIEIELTGTTPLMMHKMTNEALFGLLGVKTEKKRDKEIKTPREIGEKHAYQLDNGECYIPLEYITGSFAAVASDYKQKHSIRKSLKSVAQGIFRPTEEKIMLLDLKDKPIKKFEIDIRKATNHQKGAVAVCRPRFDEWKVKFTAQIDDNIASADTIQQVLEDAGRRSGMGSFRVSRGGYFGQFRLTRFKEL